MTKNLVIMGPPGAGKGTHAKEIATHFQIPWISTGDIFRKHKAEKTELGKLIESYIDKGEFVPDSVTDRIVCERISQTDATAGFLLDGYPRSIPQAKVLKAVLAETNERVDAAIYLDVSAAEVKRRLLKRAEIEGVPTTPPKSSTTVWRFSLKLRSPCWTFMSRKACCARSMGRAPFLRLPSACLR